MMQGEERLDDTQQKHAPRGDDPPPVLSVGAAWHRNARSGRLELVATLLTEHEGRRPVDVAFAIDDSGSIGHVKGLIWRVVGFICERLDPEDRVAALAFDDRVRSVFPAVGRSIREESERGAGNTTNISQAVEAAASALLLPSSSSPPPPRDAMLVVLTDGQPNAGVVSNDGLSALVRAHAERVRRSRPASADVSVVVFGLGSVNESTLRALASSASSPSSASGGDESGDFTLVESPEDAAELAGDVIVKAKNRPLRGVVLRAAHEGGPPGGEKGEAEEDGDPPAPSAPSPPPRWQFETGSWEPFPDDVQRRLPQQRHSGGGGGGGGGGGEAAVVEYTAAANGLRYRVLPSRGLQVRADRPELCRPVRRNRSSGLWEWQSSAGGAWLDYEDPETIARLEDAASGLVASPFSTAARSSSVVVPARRADAPHDLRVTLSVVPAAGDAQQQQRQQGLVLVAEENQPNGAGANRRVRRVPPLRFSSSSPSPPAAVFGLSSDCGEDSGAGGDGSCPRVVFDIGARVFRGAALARVVSIDPGHPSAAPGSLWSVYAEATLASTGEKVSSDPDVLLLKVPPEGEGKEEDEPSSSSSSFLETVLHSLLANAAFACQRFVAAGGAAGGPEARALEDAIRAMEEVGETRATSPLLGRAEIVDAVARLRKVVEKARQGRSREAAAAAASSSATIHQRYRYSDAFAEATRCAADFSRA